MGALGPLQPPGSPWLLPGPWGSFGSVTGVQVQYRTEVHQTVGWASPEKESQTRLGESASTDLRSQPRQGIPAPEVPGQPRFGGQCPEIVVLGVSGVMGRWSEAGLLPPAVALAFQVVFLDSLWEPKSNPDQDGGGSPPVGEMDRVAGFTSQQLAGFPFSASSYCHQWPRVPGTLRDSATDPHFFGDLERRRKMVKTASPPARLGLAFPFRFAL